MRDRIRLLAAKEAVHKALAQRQSSSKPDAEVTDALRDVFLANVPAHQTERESKPVAERHVASEIRERFIRQRNELLKQKKVSLQDLRRAIPNLERLEKQAVESYATRFVARHHSEARAEAVDRQRKSLQLKLDIPRQGSVDNETTQWTRVRETLAEELATQAVSEPLFRENSQFVLEEAGNVVALIDSEFQAQHGIVETHMNEIPEELRTKRQLAAWFDKHLSAHIAGRDEPRLEGYGVFASHLRTLAQRTTTLEADRFTSYLRRCELPPLPDLATAIRENLTEHRTSADSLERFHELGLPKLTVHLARTYAKFAGAEDEPVVTRFEELANQDSNQRIASLRLRSQLREALPTARDAVRDAQVKAHFTALAEWRPTEKLVVSLNADASLKPTNYADAMRITQLAKPGRPLVEETERAVVTQTRQTIQDALGSFRRQRRDVDAFVSRHQGDLRKDVKSGRPKPQVVADWKRRFVTKWNSDNEDAEYDLYQTPLQDVFDRVSREYDGLVAEIKREEETARLAELAELAAAKRKAEKIAKARETQAPQETPDPNDPTDSAGVSVDGNAGGANLRGTLFGTLGPGTGGGPGGEGEGEGGEGKKSNGGAGGQGKADIQLVVKDSGPASCLLELPNQPSKRVTFAADSTANAAKQIMQLLAQDLRAAVTQKLTASHHSGNAKKTPLRIHLSVQSQAFRALTGVHVERELRTQLKSLDAAQRLELKWSVGP